MQHSGKFKLVVMKAESDVMSDTSWEVIADLDDLDDMLEDKTLLPFRVCSALTKAKADCDAWNAEEERFCDLPLCGLRLIPHEHKGSFAL